MVNKALTDAQLEVLSDVDILLIPVGGNNCYDAETAAKTVNTIEPKIVIPIAFNSDNDPKAASVDLFLREMGVAKNGEPENKVIIKKKDLPMEEMKVVVLNKE
jgi:L-ascorbate metabolism protein UlaG (beta-lactamase superfamily)